MKQNRILVTESQADYPKQLIQVLASHNDVILYAVAKNVDELATLLTEYKNVVTIIPILLDIEKNAGETRQLVKHLPKMDVIINFTGPVLLDKLPKSVKYKTEEINIHPHSKIEKVVNRLLSNSAKSPKAGDGSEPKSQSLLINIIYSDGSNMPPASPSPTPQQSATVVAKQVTNTLRSSFRKLFKKSASMPVEPEPTAGAAAGSSNFGARQARTLPSGSTPLKSPNQNLALLNLNAFDFKISKKLHKLFKEYQKKWSGKEKDFRSWEKKQLKGLNHNMTKYKRDEEALMKQSNDEANAATIARSNVLSIETTNEIIKRRELWAQKKVGRKADLKFKVDKAALEEAIVAEKQRQIQKFYEKLFAKQMEVLEKYVT